MNKTQTASQQSTSHDSNQPTSRLTTPNAVLDVSLEYHTGVLDGDIEHWASVAGVTVAELKQATGAIVRTCHHAAVLATKGDASHPDVHELGIGQLKVIYTVEPNGVVIRGYTPNIPDWQVREEEAGRFFCENSWGSRKNPTN